MLTARLRGLIKTPLLVFLLFSVTVNGQEAPLAAAPPVDAEVLASKIAEVGASTTLDEGAAATRIDLYRRALSNLEKARVEASQAEAFASTAAAAPAELAAVRQAIEAQQLELDKVNVPIPQTAVLSELEQALRKTKAELGEAEAQLAGLRDKYTSELGRPMVARDRLAAARTEQTNTDAELAAPAPVDEAAELTEARRWQLDARRYRLGAEIKKLDQELLTHAPRLELLQAQRDLAGQTVDTGRARTRRFEDAISERRGATAKLAKQRAETTRQELEGRPPAIRDLARGNVEVSALMAQRVLDIQDASKERDGLREQATNIADSLSSTRNRLAIGGLNQVLGQVLVEQRRALPNITRLKARGRDIEQRVSDVGLEQFQLVQQRRELRDITSYVDSLTTGLADEEVSEIRPELVTLAESRRGLVQEAIDAGSRYLQVLGELDLAQRQLENSVSELGDFLERRLLWVRNTIPFDIDALDSVPGDIERLASPKLLRQLAGDFVAALRTMPYLAVVIVLLLLLGAMRGRFIAGIISCAERIGRISTDSFRYSVEAVTFTGLAAAPLPLALLVSGFAISAYVDAAVVPIALAISMAKVAGDLLLIQFFLDACHDNGLFREHCGWSKHAVTKLRHELRWFRWVFPVSRFVGEASFQLDSGAQMGGLAALGLVGAAAALSILLFRLLTPHGGTLRDYIQEHPNSLIAKLRPLWLTAATLVLPMLIVLWLSGYNYSATLLSVSFMYSIWLVLALVLLHGLLSRWLRLGYQRLELKAAIERRDAARLARIAAAEGSDSEGDLEQTEVDEPEIDLAGLDSDSRRLLRTIIAFVTLVWLWFIWAPILPALSVLQEVSLWTAMRTVNGETMQTAVTLADLLVVLIVVIATGAAARGLPAFVELLLLQRTSVTAGARYTASTLTRYAIVGTGTIVVFGILGASWGQLQWLVAALGVGIGFGLQEIVANFISGLIILFERPIRVGDIVSVGETSGVVTRINIRATTIRDWDHRELLVPNREFITGRLLNWTLSDNIQRVVVPVGVAYDSNVGLAMKIAEEVAVDNDDVLDDPQPFVVFESFGDNTINLSLRAYVPSFNVLIKVKTNLHSELNNSLRKAGIVIAYPQRDVHLDTSRPLEISLQHSGATPLGDAAE